MTKFVSVKKTGEVLYVIKNEKKKDYSNSLKREKCFFLLLPLLLQYEDNERFKHIIVRKSAFKTDRSSCFKQDVIIAFKR